jgi:TusA-related sulfurtransferase
MAKEIDVRGLSCPQPLIITKKAVDAGETEIKVLADDAVARDNVKRMAETAGFTVTITEQDDEFILEMTKG